ncbi:MAG TPA: Gfo/Idh/MocA family oxidoreductase [Planctomycetota bacterium]|jgi:predicted dehydrogenase|nr:Gfo/Idh/MocA family oxidoreductase [Planctomycetota bacterium]OQC19155.1 MAG: Inositol 2-dehydrogenase [Planctomycetes bacterium ADurb.Bin069]HNS00441.1 Gfo/Idh/MocA family oxidoreductase [Planctomycetota bacterium]HNU27280.1 Gfo/Idh/MocA family oxidoreductase [Planctomycetota bacterium]HOE31387.1 Gfo/Idh/MocA family oxidoreductase [Planctomycetota bacterium]
MRMNRRGFVGSAAAAGAAASFASRVLGANDRLVAGVMGVHGRGTQLARVLAGLKSSAVACVCDVDARSMTAAAAAVSSVQVYKPEEVGDVRRLLENPVVDALVIAAPNHWHGPATILACKAGKHVYVEKPCCHNPREGELMVAAARAHKRVVQVGTQRRSWPAVIEAMEAVRGGAIGRAFFARGRYTSARGSIGRGKEAPVPDWLDYELWQGPAPRRPFTDNRIHYNWHWFWHWGNGELGNNGVHALDLCRWGLGAGYPVRVSSSGGRYFYDDDQETPDTHEVMFEFADKKAIAWEGLSCNRNWLGSRDWIASFYGDKGALALWDGAYTIFDRNDKVVREGRGPGGDEAHLQNFVDCARAGGRPSADIEEGHKSTLLPHLGNIAHRVGRSLKCDPASGRILGDEEAMGLWGREYAPGWEPSL